MAVTSTSTGTGHMELELTVAMQCAKRGYTATYCISTLVPVEGHQFALLP